MKIKFAICFVAALLLFFSIFHFVVDRVYVPEGKSLLLRYKGPIFLGSSKYAKHGHWAEEGEVGVLKNLRGPGRHYYSPIWFERTFVNDITILPGEVGIVTCKLGDSLPEGRFLVDGEIGETSNKGVLRKCLGPGRYRINPYGYDVQIIKTQEIITGNTKKHSGWVTIPIGYVGVVTNMADNPINKQLSGIQDLVLPPGLYPINPREQQIDIVKIGCWETSVDIEVDKPFSELVRISGDVKNLENQIKGGIQFPSSDGFNIVMDFTAIWGLMPHQAPNAIKNFGNVDLVESKVVLPQIESICRNNGSEYSATQLLVGAEREVFQNETLDEFRHILNEKNISLFYGSVKHIYIPHEVRLPIQMAFISDELALTRKQEQLTAKEEANLKEAEKQVILETARVNAETTKMVAQKNAQGEKEAREIDAETTQLIAAIEKKTAEIDAQAALLIGQAENEGLKVIEEAKANRFKLAVEAFGSTSSYNNWIFAENLPEGIELKLIYAGPGTMWTDLKEAIRIMAPSVPAPAKPVSN